MDIAFMSMRWRSGLVASIEMARSAPYGYDQRCEAFGTKGMLQVGNVHETSMSAWTADGRKDSVLQYSFPQRFQAAYEAEVEHFVAVAGGAEAPAVSQRDSILATVIAEAARQSAVEGCRAKLMLDGDIPAFELIQ